MKRFFLLFSLSAFIMFALPWCAVTFVKGDAGMAVCFILFFAVDPVHSLILGVFAGMDIKTMWCLPILSAVFFLAGTWIFFDPGETAFLLYAAIYLALGLAAMPVTALIRKKTKR